MRILRDLFQMALPKWVIIPVSTRKSDYLSVGFRDRTLSGESMGHSLLLQDWIPRLKPELNHLYFRPPREAGGEGASDLGWFCREHALHLHSLALLLGHSSELCEGDFVIQCLPRPGETIQVVSIGESRPHAWCIVDELRPVDVSPSVRLLTGGFTAPGNDVPAILGPPSETTPAPYLVRYVVNLPDEEFRAVCPATPDPQHRPEIDERVAALCYNQKSVAVFDPLELLADPYRVICPPPLGIPKFTQIHGPDVFFALTAHLLQVVSGKVKGFAPYREPDSALAAILTRHPQARREIEQRWSEVRKGKPS